MAVRTTVSEVKLIMTATTASDEAITALIAAASGIVDRVFEYNSDLSATTLEFIEQFLTAHLLVSTFDRMASEEKVGDAMIRYTGKYGTGLEGTPYGQMVLLLDTTGLMAKTSKLGATITAIKSFD